jgi:hypothetical protein
MAAYAFKRFNGNSFATSDYEIGILAPLAAASNVYLAQAMEDAQDSGAFSVGVRSITLRVKIKNAAQSETLEENLKLYFERGLRGLLEVTFRDDGQDYFLPCSVANITQDRVFTTTWVVVMESKATYWRTVSAATDTWTPSGTSGNKTFTVGGKANTKLSFTLTPTVGPTSGYLYRQLYQLVNVPLVDYGVRPWCLTVDTLALVAQNANKCQINNGAGIDASQTTIPYDTVTGSIPSVGMGYLGTEQISWTGRTGTTSGNLTGCVRGINGTVAAVHADNVEIKVSLVRADLNDYRVWLGDAEAKRWIDSPASATTKIWFNARLTPGFDLVLKTAVADSGTPAYLQFTVDATHTARINAMPATGLVIHGNEWFAYSAKDGVNCRLTISTRGFLGTTIEAHNAGVTFKYVCTPITITYGNAGATAPAAGDDHYDDDKPMFDLSQSDNTKWAYTSTSGFYDVNHPSRPGSLTPFLTKLGNETETYLIADNAESGNPVIGVEVGTWLSGTTWKGETVTGGFAFYSAGGIWKISRAGRKLKSGTNWLSKAGLQKSLIGTAWVDLTMETTPAAVGAYTNYSYTDTVVTAPTVTVLASMFKSLRVGAFGTYAAATDVYTRIEDSGWTVYFVSANIPTGTFLSAVNNITLDVTITAAPIGDSLRIVSPMLLGKEIAADGESNVVTLDGVNAQGILTLNDDSRSQFLRLAAGSNELSITSPDMGMLSIGLSAYARRP